MYLMVFRVDCDCGFSPGARSAGKPRLTEPLLSLSRNCAEPAQTPNGAFYIASIATVAQETVSYTSVSYQA